MRLDLPLTVVMKERFRKSGFVKVSGCLEAPAMACLLDEATNLVEQSAIPIRRESTAGCLDYSVVTGERIASAGPRIFGLYANPCLLEWIRYITECRELTRSEHQRSSVNINCMERKGQEYPWHFDAVPYTAVLFLTSASEEDGGQLRVRGLDNAIYTISPAAGELVLMDGKACEHSVAPLLTSAVRLTVPMVFPVTQDRRPDGLDEYLYRG
jgi:hypothetical protein